MANDVDNVDGPSAESDNLEFSHEHDGEDTALRVGERPGDDGVSESETKVERRPIKLDILFLVFGVSAWAAVNGLWVESPLLVRHLPEAWNLASYIVILTQIANIGPLGYTFLRRYFKSDDFEKWSIHAIMAIGTISCIFLIFFWDRQDVIGGKSHSVAFLALTASLAMVDCTSSVLYLPFVAHFEHEYVRPLIVGEGLSGLIPSIASLIQGVGGNPKCVKEITANGTIKWKAKYPDPRFSVSTFFIFLTIVMMASWLAFTAINVCDFAKKRRVAKDKPRKTDETTDLNSICDLTELSKTRFVSLLILQSYVCGLMNGVIASISTYSILPYGNVTYHIATNFAVISGPVAAFLVFSIHRKRRYQKPIIPLAIGGTIASLYIIYVAASSPKTPLQGTAAGSALIIIVWLVYHGCFSYVKACIAGTMRTCSFGGHKALFYYGVFTQIGSFVGAFMMFFIVNYGKVFHSYSPCH